MYKEVSGVGRKTGRELRGKIVLRIGEWTRKKVTVISHINQGHNSAAPDLSDLQPGSPISEGTKHPDELERRL